MPVNQDSKGFKGIGMTEREIKRAEFAKNSVYREPIKQIDKSAIIHRSSFIGQSGFGYARDSDNTLIKINHAGGVRIEANVEIRAHCTIDRATNAGAFTVIGEGNCIDHGTHIAHNVTIGKNNTLAAHCIIEGSCQVGDNNTFGAGVIMQRKTKLGNGNTIGSGSVITKDFGDNLVIIGSPARILRTKE